jgi:hypothetical protein
MKLLSIAVFCALLTAAVGAQDEFSKARDLYTAASYEEALALLTNLHTEKADQYQAFCLFALGRTNEATSVAEHLIAADPLLELESDASPRIAAMFTDARKRLLPALVRDQYRSARAAMERKDFATAEPQLARVRKLLDRAAAVGITDETLGDLGVLADGFLELARAGKAAAAKAETPAAAAEGQRVASQMPPVEAAKARAPHVFDSTASDVVAPVPVRQDLPPIPRELVKVAGASVNAGILEVVIDERGAVEKAIIRESILPLYDSLLVAATRNWRYQPALRQGMPVKYVKVIAVNVKGDLFSR